MHTTLHCALVQLQGHADFKAAQKQVADSFEAAHAQGATLVVLPELHHHLYFPKSIDQSAFELAESLDGPTAQQLSQLAKKYGVVVIGSIFEKRASGLYHNTALVFEKTGKLLGYYRKMHIPDDPGFYEKYYFAPGDLGFWPIQTSVGRLGVLVCWDQWFPEAARLMALRGAEVLIYPTAIGGCADESMQTVAADKNAWEVIQQAHAIANGIYVVTCNRVGYEASEHQSIQFWGSSFIAGPRGERLAQLSDTTPEVLVKTIDLTEINRTRNTWPFLRDRRIDAYDGLCTLFDNLKQN